jgi:shikimate dehydrogenase
VSKTEQGPATRQELLLALIGHPVSHSLSPAMHKAALAHFKLAGNYSAIDIEPEELADNIDMLRTHFSGFNVTVPHKQAIMPFLHKMTDAATSIGAVNTVRRESDGTLTGHNTDASGFSAAAARKRELKGQSVSVIGSGGAARAALWALIDAGASRLCLVARNQNNAQELLSDFEGLAQGKTQLETREPGQQNQRDDSFGLLVNCTPIGLMEDFVPDWFASELQLLATDGLFFDMVYAHGKDTPLVKRAREAGFDAVGGLSMLISQARLAFEFWTNLLPPEDVMTNAIAKT